MITNLILNYPLSLFSCFFLLLSSPPSSLPPSPSSFFSFLASFRTLTDVDPDLHPSSFDPSSLQFPQNGNIGLNTIQAWWGNTVWQHTADFRSIPLKRPAPGSIFGCVLFFPFRLSPPGSRVRVLICVSSWFLPFGSNRPSEW